MTTIVTHEMLMLIASRIEGRFPAEATKLRFCASDVQWLENRVNELVSDEVAATQAKRIYHA